MKTNVTMVSTDRDLFGVKIRQQTKNGFLNLSDLNDAYHNAISLHGWSERRIDHIISSRENIERIYYLLEKQEIINVSFHTFIEMVENDGINKVLKQLGVYKTTGARHTKTTWANPYIWVLVSMELNPMLYAQTVMWLTDKLIINRIEAGNFYKELTKAIGRFSNVDYVQLAKGLNFVVFGRHETGIRNTATQNQLKEMETLEGRLAFAINMGYIKTFESLIDELRKIYNQKTSI